MKILILTFTLFTSLIGVSQESPYIKNMQEALTTYSKAKTIEDHINVSYKFEQIASVETENWLPLYYHALSYTMSSYIVSNDNKARKDELLDIAFSSITKIKKMAPTQSEIFALEALFYTARLSVNPMERGQKYSTLSMATVKKALALNPNNVRAKQLQITNEFGLAQFFGSDTAPICKKALALLSIWDDYKIESPIHPNWGKEYLESLVKSCKPDNTKEKSQSKLNEIKNTPSLTLKISDLSSNKGIVLIQLLNEKSEIVKSIKGNIEDTESIVIITDLEKGRYSIKYFHDLNNNMALDVDKYGRPTEGYGYSNNVKGTMGPPKFSKTLFDFSSNLTLYLKTRN